MEDVDPLLPRLTVAQKSVQEYSVFKAKPSQDAIKLQGVASQDSQMKSTEARTFPMSGVTILASDVS